VHAYTLECFEVIGRLCWNIFLATHGCVLVYASAGVLYPNLLWEYGFVDAAQFVQSAQLPESGWSVTNSDSVFFHLSKWAACCQSDFSLSVLFSRALFPPVYSFFLLLSFWRSHWDKIGLKKEWDIPYSSYFSFQPVFILCTFSGLANVILLIAVALHVHFSGCGRA